MKIQFWGVRGSIPAPLTPQQIQSKIIAAVQRITPKDIENSDSRERFISSLPSWIFGTTGGNTPCTVITDGPTKIILDMGSGLRAYGKSQGCLEGLRKYHIFSSHFHWDHIHGLPFFDPAFMKDSEIHFYSPFPKAKQILQNQMKRPYLPVPFEAFTFFLGVFLLLEIAPTFFFVGVFSSDKFKVLKSLILVDFGISNPSSIIIITFYKYITS